MLLATKIGERNSGNHRENAKPCVVHPNDVLNKVVFFPLIADIPTQSPPPYLLLFCFPSEDSRLLRDIN